MNDSYPTGGLVDTAWLAAHLDDPKVRILDASYILPGIGRDARQEYEARHIPGAVFFDLDAIADPATDLPHMLPTPAEFAMAVGSLGIGNEHFVVAYDSFGLMSSARIWWMFRVFGHDAVAVLDGGLPKWEAEGRPVSSRPEGPVPALFLPGFRPELVRDIDEVGATLAAGRVPVIDGRSAGRFEGTEPETWPGRRQGHMPGSLNLPYSTLIDPVSKTLLPPDALRASFEAIGVGDHTAAICACGSGLTAAVVALALHRIGAPDAAIYDGSWAEWGRREDLPVALGPARPHGTVGLP